MFGLASAVAAFLIWALSGSLLLRSIPLPGPVVTWFGFAVGALFLGVTVAKRRARELRLAKERYLHKLLLVGIAFAGVSLCYQSAVKATTVANAILTHSTQAVLTAAVFVPLFLRTRVPKTGFIAVVLGFLGLVILLAPQLTWYGSFWGNSWGIILGLLSAVFYAWFNVQVPAFKDALPQDVILTFALGISSLLLLPFAILSWSPGLTIDSVTVVKLIIFGLLNNMLGNILYYYALRKRPVDQVTALSYLEPVIAIAAAAVFLGEPVKSTAALGGAIILASSAIAVFGEQLPFLRKTANS
ncbi:MAG: DMT family transporter [Patescibacteria group bacterium]